jgi:hypothetical protein
MFADRSETIALASTSVFEVDQELRRRGGRDDTGEILNANHSLEITDAGSRENQRTQRGPVAEGAASATRRQV